MAPLLPVQSSMLSHIGYDPASRVFAARFKDSNYVHHHKDVPPEAANPVLDAARIEGGSVGKAFNAFIRGRFDVTQIALDDNAPVDAAADAEA